MFPIEKRVNYRWMSCIRRFRTSREWEIPANMKPEKCALENLLCVQLMCSDIHTSERQMYIQCDHSHPLYIIWRFLAVHTFLYTKCDLWHFIILYICAMKKFNFNKHILCTQFVSLRMYNLLCTFIAPFLCNKRNILLHIWCSTQTVKTATLVRIFYRLMSMENIFQCTFLGSLCKLLTLVKIEIDPLSRN